MKKNVPNIIAVQCSVVQCCIVAVMQCCSAVQCNALNINTGECNTVKQGSSENDGRSDVYDRSEFKVISNCCYTNCCRTNCGHFTCIYLNLPEFT